MSDEHHENIEVSDEAIDAVQNLISICKDAEKNNLDLVHLWFL